VKQRNNSSAGGKDHLLSDIELVRRIRTGEKDLFRLLVERHQRRIFFLGRRFFRKPEDVEDFTQEVFLRAFRKLGSFSGAREGRDNSFSGWLYTLAYRWAINTKRAYRSIREDFFPEIEVPGRDNTVDEVIREDTIHRVRKELERLPGLYTMLVHLKYYEGFSYVRISGITGIPVGTIKSHIYRCKQLLKERMNAEQDW